VPRRVGQIPWGHNTITVDTIKAPDQPLWCHRAGEAHRRTGWGDQGSPPPGRNDKCQQWAPGRGSGSCRNRVGSSPECRVSARDTCRGLLQPTGLAQWRQACCAPVRPAVGAWLDETAAESHTAHKWLDGVSDALTDFLRRLRQTYPSATAKIRPGPTPTADYRPSRRSPWPAADEAFDGYARRTPGWCSATT